MRKILKVFSIPEDAIRLADDLWLKDGRLYVDWSLISAHQKLSEAFIDKYSDKVDWVWISCLQNISEEFIEKHADKIAWHEIASNYTVTIDFIKKFKDNLQFKYLYLNSNINDYCLMLFDYDVHPSNYPKVRVKLNNNIITEKLDIYEIGTELEVIDYAGSQWVLELKGKYYRIDSEVAVLV